MQHSFGGWILSGYMKDLSIIIVNYNGSGFIEDCLESIRKHLRGRTAKSTDVVGDGGVDFEVIIIDNASTDGSAEYLKDFCSNDQRFRLMKMGSNTGFGEASNKGAESAGGKFLLFLNPDCKMTGDDIGPLLRFYKESGSPGVVGAKIIGKSGRLHYSCRALPTLARQFYESFFLHRIFSNSRIFGSYFMSWWDHSGPGETGWLAGSFMLIDKDLFISSGGFDTDYFMYSEDADLCLRLFRMGHKNYYYPGYSIIHEDSGIASRDMAERESGIWKSRRLYFLKNYSPFHAAFLSFLYFTGVMNRIIVFGAASIFSANIRKQGRVSYYSRALKKYFCKKTI